jgi:hypothetical protein
MELREGVAPGFLNAAPVWKASKAGKDRSGGSARFGAGWQVSMAGTACEVGPKGRTCP